MKRLTALALSFAALVSDPNPAAAQDLFRAPGAIGLEPTHQSFTGGRYVGEDTAGYIYSAGSGLACHHPSDPSTVYGLDNGGFFDANGGSVGAFSFALLTPDRSAVDVAFVPQYPYWQNTNIESVRIFRVSCAALAPGGAGAMRLGGTIQRTDNALLARELSAEFTRTESGQLCFPAIDRVGIEHASPATGIVCIDLSTPTPTFSQLVDPAVLDEHLGVDPGLALGAWFGEVPPAYGWWAFSGLLSVPGGRIFFVAERNFMSVPSSPGVFSTVVARYIVERSADGRLTPRFGPTALDAGDRLVYSAALDAVLAWPTLNQEHNAADRADGGLGWTGIGFRVIPLDRPGTGYLPLTQPFAARRGCEKVPFCERLADTTALAHEGGVRITVFNSPNPNVSTYDLYTVSFDPDALDLDSDGLDAAAEAALGTFDTLPDSDGGGTPDGIEAMVVSSNPKDASDDPAGRIRIEGGLRYVPSPLIRSRLGAVDSAVAHGDAARTIGVTGPLCVAGTCYGPSGDAVAKYPVQRAVPGSSAVVSADGTFIMLETALGLVRFYFEGGREELAVSRQALDTMVPAPLGGLRIIPLDAERTWLASDGTLDPATWPAVVALAEGSNEISIRYDHAQAQRDSGLSIATDDLFLPLEEGVMASIVVVGWNAETESLQIGMRGNWDTHLFGLGLDGSVTRLARGRALAGKNAIDARQLAGLPLGYEPPIPPYLLPTGHGDYFTLGGVMEPFGGYADARVVSMTDLAPPPVGSGRAPLGIWGDVLLEALCCGFNEDGFYELVRYDQSLAPGDVLIMRSLTGGTSATDGMMLYKSGPRGGVVEVWAGTQPEIRDASGIDLANDGTMRLCVADAVSNVLWELEPAGPAGPPELVRYSADLPGILDCAYDGDGTLRVLAAGPARVMVRDGDFGDLTVDESLPSAPEPIEFVRSPDGTNEVRVRDGLRGKTYLPDGREVTMREGDFTLLIDDTPVAEVPRLVFQNALGNLPADYKARIRLGVRADGLIVLVPHHAQFDRPIATLGKAYVVDPAKGAVYELGVGDLFAHEGLSMVVVPGGVQGDPWTGRVGAGVVVPLGVDSPEVPLPPSGGEALPRADRGGCAVGRAGSAHVWPAVALGAILMCRRRRGRSCARSASAAAVSAPSAQQDRQAQQEQRRR